MTDFKKEIREADRAYERARQERRKARARLARVLRKAKDQHTGEEVAEMWGKSRQALYKLMREET